MYFASLGRSTPFSPLVLFIFLTVLLSSSGCLFECSPLLRLWHLFAAHLIQSGIVSRLNIITPTPAVLERLFLNELNSSHFANKDRKTEANRPWHAAFFLSANFAHFDVQEDKRAKS